MSVKQCASCECTEEFCECPRLVAALKALVHTQEKQLEFKDRENAALKAELEASKKAWAPGDYIQELEAEISKLKAENAGWLEKIEHCQNSHWREIETLKAENKILAQKTMEYALSPDWKSRAAKCELSAARYREALEKIARSSPCKEGHMSFNTPEQICDQRIAQSALEETES